MREALSNEYMAALESIRRAAAAYHKALVAYRAGTIGDAAFIAARNAVRAAETRFDAVWEREQTRSPNAPAGTPHRPQT
jgi:hypothetical protein